MDSKGWSTCQCLVNVWLESLINYPKSRPGIVHYDYFICLTEVAIWSWLWARNMIQCFFERNHSYGCLQSELPISLRDCWSLRRKTALFLPAPYTFVTILRLITALLESQLQSIIRSICYWSEQLFIELLLLQWACRLQISYCFWPVQGGFPSDADHVWLWMERNRNSRIQIWEDE